MPKPKITTRHQLISYLYDKIYKQKLKQSAEKRKKVEEFKTQINKLKEQLRNELEVSFIQSLQPELNTISHALVALNPNMFVQVCADWKEHKSSDESIRLLLFLKNFDEVRVPITDEHRQIARKTTEQIREINQKIDFLEKEDSDWRQKLSFLINDDERSKVLLDGLVQQLDPEDVLALKKISSKLEKLVDETSGASNNEDPFFSEKALAGVI